VVEIAARLREAGFESWCVGGAVRDALLGHENLDWDIATSATPPEVQKQFKRTVPVGIEFGTVGVLDHKKVLHEVTTFRKDVKTDGRHAVVEFGASLDDDLARRDFTINAIAYNPETGELRDPFGGQADLKRGIVRAVGKADDRMKEDRLRALRAIRFAARFGFNIESSTLAAIRASAPHLTRLSAERVHQELRKTMEQVDTASTALEWWRELGALQVLVPALAAAPRERFKALDRLPRDNPLNRLAMLWFGEEPKATERSLKALKFSNQETAWIVSLARARHELGEVNLAKAEAKQVRRWIATIGRTRTDSYFRLAGASDAQREAAVAMAFKDPVELADLAIDGEDLAKIGISKGPAMGKTLKSLLELVLDDPKLNTQAKLLAAAKGIKA
jgi:tRNA nucleotidyltransferase (CCA-adding enzyme)